MLLMNPYSRRAFLLKRDYWEDQWNRLDQKEQRMQAERFGTLIEGTVSEFLYHHKKKEKWAEKLMVQRFKLKLSKTDSIKAILMDRLYQDNIVDMMSFVDAVMLNGLAKGLYQNSSCYEGSLFLQSLDHHSVPYQRLYSSLIQVESLSDVELQEQRASAEQELKLESSSRKEQYDAYCHQERLNHVSPLQLNSPLPPVEAATPSAPPKTMEALNPLMSTVRHHQSNTCSQMGMFSNEFNVKAVIKISTNKIRILFSGSVQPLTDIFNKLLGSSNSVNDVKRNENNAELYWGNEWSRLWRTGDGLGEKSNRLEFWFPKKGISCEEVAKLVLGFFKPLMFANEQADEPAENFSFDELRDDHDYIELGTANIKKVEKLEASIKGFLDYTNKVRTSHGHNDPDGYKALPENTPSTTATQRGYRAVASDVTLTSTPSMR